MSTAVAASKITTGTFGAGDYTFQNDVTVDNNLTVKGNVSMTDGSDNVNMYFNDQGHFVIQIG